jgi:hypothetical protein
MPDTPELRSVLDAAAQAAAAGDYASAEPLLREVARLQEASLGPLHPDLANTLNNLGVVCEITGKPVDAERCFRQAWAIAAAVLAPDHPFVTTSRKNLQDFCAARGKAVDPPPPPSAVAVERDARWTGSARLRPELSPHEPSRPLASRRRPRSLAIGVLIAGGLFVTFMATTTWYRSNDEVEPSPGNPSASPPGSPVTASSPPIESIPTHVPKEVTTSRSRPVGEPRKRNTAPTTPAGRQVRKPSGEPSAAAEPRATSALIAQPPVVVGAHLCRELSTAGGRGLSSDWQCVPPSLPVGPGPLFFYTRLRSPTDTTVQHRWYRGDRLRQVVELRILANTASGYRTYSRNTVDNQGAGDWRVELRTGAGVLLHEERFVVR